MLKLKRLGGSKMSQQTFSFEKNLEKLKEIVENLESGGLSLKESLEKFQNGIGIIKQCYKELETAELKIETIMKKDGKIITESIIKK